MKKTVIIGAVAVSILVLAGVIAVYVTKRSEAENPSQKTMTAAQVQSQPEAAQSEMNFAGNINGNLKIHMNLKFKGNEVSGTYFYDKFKANIQLKGTKDNNSNIVLNEVDGKGNITGIFTGKFTIPNKIDGTWSKPHGSNKMSFSVVESNEPVKDEKKQEPWDGEWLDVKSNQFSDSELVIKNVTDTSFDFRINAHNGTHSGNLENKAKRINKNTAVFDDKENKFKLTLTLIGDVLKVESVGENYYAGSGVSFDGQYKRGIKPKRLTLKDIGVFKNDAQEQTFKNVVRGRYEKFLEYFQWTSKDTEDEFGADVYVGNLKGFAQNSMIMYTKDNKIWAVILADEIEYFTNVPEYKEKLPKAIDEWIKRFNGSNIKYMSR